MNKAITAALSAICCLTATAGNFKLTCNIRNMLPYGNRRKFQADMQYRRTVARRYCGLRPLSTYKVPHAAHRHRAGHGSRQGSDSHGCGQSV